MLHWVAPFALLIISSAAADQDAAFRCSPERVLHYEHKSDLPEGAEAALDLDMAEAGAPFQEGNIISPGGAARPRNRFIVAEIRGCQLTVEYERGGRGRSIEHRSIRFIDGRWTAPAE